MRMRLLGKTGVAVSEVGFGTGDNAGLMVKADHRSQLEVISRALESGVNYFDIAPNYGWGLAENNVGDCLRELGAIDRVVLSTKVELYLNHIGNFEKAVEAGVDATLGRLGVDSIDVVIIHNPIYEARQEPYTRWVQVTIDEMLGPIRAGLQRVLEQGKVRHVGISGESGSAAPTVAVFDSGLYEVANIAFNLANPTARSRLAPRVQRDPSYSGMLDGAGANGVGVAVIRPLAGGLLTDAVFDGGAAVRHPLAGGSLSRPGVLDSLLREAKGVKAAQQKLGLGMTELAYRFVFAQREVSTVLGGYSELGHLEDLLAAQAKGPLSADQLEVVEDSLS